MTPDQVEVLSKIVTLTSGAAAAALALAQLAKTLLEVSDKLRRRRRRARRRPRRGPRPGPGRGRAPPGRQRARRLEYPPLAICGRVRATRPTVYTWQALES